MSTGTFHKKCGGLVVNKKCQKCGKVWSLIKYSITSELEEREIPFDRNAYRDRIRRGGDIGGHRS